MNNVVDKFTTHLRSVLTRALCFVSDAGASEIGPEHLLWSVATEDGSIGAEILKKASLDVEVLGKLVGAPTELDISTLDVTSIPVLSEHSKKIIEKAVLTAAVYEHSFVGTEHLVAGLLQAGGRDLAEVVKHTSLHIDNVRKQLNTILQGTRQFPNIQNPVGDVVRDTEELVDDSSALEFFATELTSLEQNLDPVIGRDDEINRMLEILSRRTKNNPLLIGDPGVGKTAIVEGLARRIVEGKVPPSLKEKRIFALDMSSLVAGTIYRGEFEGRLKQIVEEVRDRPEVILFIDEIHTITGAGAAAGSIDAANMLKPALARGWIRCIGATTPDEYKKSIESDGALDRRMQTVRVEEPSVDDTIDILRGIAPLYEEHHKVSIDDDALVYAAQASDRYMPSEHLPDKAIDLVDEAAASLQLKGKAYARIVTSSTIADAVFKKTGVRVSGQLKSDDAARLRGLSKKLKTRLFGQDEVVEAVSTHVRRAKLGVSSSSRPLASFLFVGPSGTGKSELARLLATELYSREDALVRLDMSEFVEGYSVSKLVGSPAGYVGYRDYALLTDGVKQRPNSVVLFDEIEKAHPDVHNLLLQILEYGELTDSTGKKVSFRQAIIIMTSNIGTQKLANGAIGFNNMQLDEKDVRNLLKDQLRPELLNRLDKICLFNPLDQRRLAQVAKRELELLRLLLSKDELDLTWDTALLRHIVSASNTEEGGARSIRQQVDTLIGALIADHLLDNPETSKLHISINNKQIDLEGQTR